ncbi:GTP-binding protein [Candidatus Heimdallarchaeota archaeon]|nr:MAG: GTP-binding protein [Candidatus Heimdallarchaeota archaeon]
MTKKRQKADFLWKIVLCGDAYVGKTTIRKRAMGEHFQEEYLSTVGADFSSYKMKLEDLRVGFQIWDLAGQEKYRYIRSSFYGGATSCFLVFDVTNPKSLTNLTKWVDEAIRYSQGGIEIFIVCGNKIDLTDQRQISSEQAKRYTEALRDSSGLKCEYIETSALTGENINQAFTLMANCLLEREEITPAYKTPIQREEKSPERETSVQPTTPVQPSPSQSPMQQKEEKLQQLQKEISTRTKKYPSEKEATVTSSPKTEPSKPTISREVIPQKIERKETNETDQLIAEVTELLEETNDLIIGKEKQANGSERTITITKDKLDREKMGKEEEISTSPQLESILSQINSKLENLSKRLVGIESELSRVKAKQQEKKKLEEQIETISDQKPIEKTETSDEKLISSSRSSLETPDLSEKQDYYEIDEVEEEDLYEVSSTEDHLAISEQKIPEETTEEEEPIIQGIEVQEIGQEFDSDPYDLEEEMLSDDELQKEPIDKEMEFDIEKEEAEEEDSQKILEELVQDSFIQEEKEESEPIIEEGITGQDSTESQLSETESSFEEEEEFDENEDDRLQKKYELLEKGEQEPDSRKTSGDIDQSEDRGIIGTELSSAMISELKNMSSEEDEEKKSQKESITRHRKGNKNDKKCPICGRELKYIRQHHRYYCVNCGRYVY